MSEFNIEKGQRFNKLTVLYECVTPPESKVRGRHYYCHCDCGRKTIVPGTYLHRDKKKSCGKCHRRGRPKKGKK